MKFLFAALASFLFATGAFAEMIDADDLANLPSISNPQVIVSAPGLAAVQPHASLKFSHASCARKLPLKLDVTDIGGLLLVKVIVPHGTVDCMSVPTVRSYNIQLSSDFQYQKVVVLNPIEAARLEAPSLPRICTQNSGILVNIENGQCRGFINGCQEQDMLANGYRRPIDDDCRGS